MESNFTRQENRHSKAFIEATDALQAKKRRAAFGDLTNNDAGGLGAKKKCAKKESQLIKPVAGTTRLGKNVVSQQNTTKTTTVARVSTAPLNQSTVNVNQHSQECEEKLIVKSEVVRPEPIGECSETTVTCTAEEVRSDSQPSESVSHSETAPTNSRVDYPSDAEMDDLCDRFEWIDVDKENRDSPFYVTDYVNDIFLYYKEREPQFSVTDYMSSQTELSINMRAILVDWLVEVQQNFELNHESLYLAVKMVDLFLVKQKVEKDRLQLVGATALSIACKFEERSPPVLDDYLYICDDAYTRDDLLEMETVLLTTLGFDIGMPLSYTFLRRYAQCGRVSIPTLTLARFMLETSLMDYAYVRCSESRLAAAALLLAMRMNSEGCWDGTMVHYTGFVVSDLADLARQLNRMVTSPTHKSLTTILTKYSHKIFHEVALISALTDLELNNLLNTELLLG